MQLTIAITSNAFEDDRKLFCGDMQTITNLIDRVDIYGHPSQRQHEIVRYPLSVNLCDINWDETVTILYSFTKKIVLD